MESVTSGNYSTSFRLPLCSVGSLAPSPYHQGYLSNHKILHLKRCLLLVFTPTGSHLTILCHRTVTPPPPPQARVMSQYERILEREECDLPAEFLGFLSYQFSNQNILGRAHPLPPITELCFSKVSAVTFKI